MRSVQLIRGAVVEYVASGYNAPVEGAGRDIIGNIVPENMVAAEKRLEELSEAWDWSCSN